ncbi:MAG: hypothetical protein QNJ94_10090 [Alphaproteobacteria bacterium]|nr:hypothetical protein [Alphaproteobacteria bacterium]
MATGSDIYMEDAFKQFDAHLADCTKKSGYDPDNVGSLGKYQIARGEDKWRKCAYEGVKTILIPKTSNPGLYTTLIQTHQILTENMRRKATTRAERRAKIEDLVFDIQLKEAQRLGTSPGSPEELQRESQEKKTERMRGMVDSLRSFSYGRP